MQHYFTTFEDSIMETVGTIKRNVNDEHNVEWLIPPFGFFLSDKAYYDSPTFPFDNALWRLRLNLDVDLENNCIKSLQLVLWRRSGAKKSLDFSLNIKNSDGRKVKEKYYVHDFKKGDIYDSDVFLTSSEFEREPFLLSAFEVITVVCAFKHSESNEYLASEKFFNDFKTILLSGDHSDIVLKVKTEEFRLHRSILAARNSYFDAMFKSGMKENTTGIITIHDCEPNIFRSFINFIYSGKVENLSPENVCELYKVADKYQEDELKAQCLHFMLNTMAIDNFCDYFTLTFTHAEEELLHNSLVFFSINNCKITCTVKWQEFEKEYPSEAMELLMKLISNNKYLQK